nr:hypothetical protein CFP56_76712 [Quercus suber]
MARLIDLGVPEPSNLVGAQSEVNGEVSISSSCLVGEEEQIDPNLGLFSEALTCYPIATQLARYLDLNSLHELSRTCRRFRFNMLQYRSALIEHTLRCSNEKTNPAQKLGHALFASHQIWTAYGRDGVKIGRVTGGQVGTCARDLVGGCRRCGEVVCRVSVMIDRCIVLQH